MARERDLWRLAGANRRRFGYCLLGGWTMFSLVFLIAMVDLGCETCPDGAIDRFLGLKILCFCALYAMAPWVILVLGIHQDTPVAAGLPLSRRQINQTLLLSGGLMFLCCLPAWAFLVWRLPIHGIPVQPWMFVSCGLGLFLYQLFGMRVNLFWRAAVPGIVPLLIFPPHSHETFRVILGAMATPWPSLFLFAVVLALIPRTLAHPLPPKARGA